MRKISFSILILLVLQCMVSGCGGTNTPASMLATKTMQIGSKTYTLEIADDDASREHGLMERDTLGSDHGMIFVFSKVTDGSFWMYHTRFPLDIIFVDTDCKVVSTATMKPYDKTPVLSKGWYQYAIELSAGEVAPNGVKPGDLLRIPQALLGKK